jgi:hypothetical protein
MRADSRPKLPSSNPARALARLAHGAGGARH